MTSSQEPPLTRREMRERERMLEQQRAASSAPDAAAPAPAQQSPPRPQQYPQQQAQPAYPQGQDPRSAQPARPAAGGPSGMPPERRADPRQADPLQAPPAQRPPQGWNDPRRQQGPPAPGAPTQAPQRAAQPPRSATTSGPMPVPVDDRRYPGQRQATPGAAPPRPPQGPPRSAPAPQTTPERTLTRRELRAMLESHSGDGFDDVDDLEPEAAPPHPTPAGVGPQRRPNAPVAGRPHDEGQPSRHPHQSAPTRAAAPHTTVDAGLDEPVVAPKPVGHWTSQLNLPDDHSEPYDQLLSRGGSARGVPTTTNALILPSLPDQGPLGQQLAPSGEIIVTGSIDLPRSYGATGVHPSQVDSSDVDRLFDSVEDVAGPGVAPVSATRAISTQQPSKAMMAPPSKEGMNVPLVLAVTAGVLALGVVATLVVGAMAGLF